MGNHKTIIVIEDDPIDFKFLNVIIEYIGDYKVKHIESAEIARDYLKECDKDQIMAVVLDLGLPGTGGLDFLREIRNAYPHLKVIISTGSDRREDVIQALRFGAFDFINKPVSQERFQSCIAHIERARSEHKARLGVSLLDDKNSIKPMAEIEREVAERVLKYCNHNVSEAARSLNVTRATFYKKIK